MYHQSSVWSFSDSSYIIWKMLAPLIYMALFHCHWIGNFVLEWRNSCYTRPILKGIFFCVSLFHIDQCLPSLFCLVISTILSNFHIDPCLPSLCLVISTILSNFLIDQCLPSLCLVISTILSDFHIDQCLPSLCLVISTILSKYNTVLFLLYLITLTLHLRLFVTKNFWQISRTLFAAKLPAIRPVIESAEGRVVKLSVQSLCLSWSPVIIQLFRSFVIGSHESGWDHMAGESVSLTRLLLSGQSSSVCLEVKLMAFRP
jgi:hypothetical protein